jgi:VWFA-related protein
MSGEGAAGDVRADVADNETANFTLEDIFNRPDRAPNRVAADYLLQHRVLSTLEALSSIAKGLADIPGQKNLIWLSSGFPLESWSATRNPAGGVSTIGRSQTFQRDAQRMTNELNAANMNLYAVDARGLSISRRAHINIGVMRQFAEETGGKAYADTNDLAGSVRAAIDDSRIGYVLTYSPDNYGEEGVRHEIKIKTSRRGVALRYRPGYSAR